MKKSSGFQDVNTLQQNLSQKTYELEALKKSYSQVGMVSDRLGDQNDHFLQLSIQTYPNILLLLKKTENKSMVFHGTITFDSIQIQKRFFFIGNKTQQMVIYIFAIGKTLVLWQWCPTLRNGTGIQLHNFIATKNGRPGYRPGMLIIIWPVRCLPNYSKL